MDELIIRSLQGRTTPAEEESLEAWRRRNPQNERRYRELRALWSLTGAAAPSEVDDDWLPAVDDIVERADAKNEETDADVTPITTGRTGESPRARREGAGSPWVRRAAVGALAAGLVAVGFGIGTLVNQERGPGLLSEGEIVTGAGEMTTITLADGSSIRLGPRSRLRLGEEDDERTAWLEGRAFFGVQADSSRPFTVHTEYGRARVLGTRFEVRSEADDDEFRVLVVEGAVSVAAGGSEVSVSQGEMSRSLRGGRPSTERVDDIYAQLDWLGDALVFQETPLRQALTEIERRYDVMVDLRDPVLADLTVTATFTGQPLEEVLFVLCEIANTTCTLEGDRVRIGGGAVEADDASPAANVR